MKRLLAFILAIAIALASEDWPTYHCNFSGSGNGCSFWNLQTDHENYRFHITSYNNNVTIVEIDGSKAAVIGPDICEYFKLVRVIRINWNAGLEYIRPEAFLSCHLNTLDISRNNVTDLEFFKNTGNLGSFRWYYGKITTLPIDIFRNWTSMTSFTWDVGDLEDFPAQLIRNMPKLNYLKLEGNELKDLQVERIVIYAPQLKFLLFDDNPIKCSRHREIRRFLSSNNIEYFPANFGKPRDYPMERDGNYRCIKD